MGRESRTISVLEGDWERWKDLAWAARLSLSEFVRKAVEAYSEQSTREDAPKATRGRGVRQSDSAVVLVPPCEATPNAAPREEGNPDAHAETYRVRSEALDTPLSHAEEIDSVIPPFRGSFPKEAQTRRRKK